MKKEDFKMNSNGKLAFEPRSGMFLILLRSDIATVQEVGEVFQQQEEEGTGEAAH
jgi:hypothetical protein